MGSGVDYAPNSVISRKFGRTFSALNVTLDKITFVNTITFVAYLEVAL
jgi:hypothetical protein